MPMNRVQFQPGLSLPMFLRRYGTERACEKALIQARWPAGFVCPSCATRAHSTFLRGGMLYWQCSACHHQTSLHAGTVFENTKLPLTTWFLALYLLTQSKTNIAALELTRHLGVCYRTAWRMKHKLMQAMTERESTRRLDGFVQLDDAYLGGERTGGKPGRGSENKRSFVIAVATDERGRPGTAVIEPVSGFSKKAIAEWAQRRLTPDAEVYSDGLGGFRAVVDCDHAHTVIDAGGGRAATEVAGARWVNIVLGNVKRALDGTYHSFHFFKYAQRYLGEAAWRFNRRFQLDAIMPRLLVASARCRPWTEGKLRNIPIFAC
jgi:ribosomal protein L37AE/L43A